MNRKTLRILNSFEWLKNGTPHRLALLTALILSAISLLLVLLTHFFWHRYIDIATPLIVALLIAVIAYFIIYWVLEYFIYRKIKLIYKIIRKQKMPRGVPKTIIDMNVPIIENTEAEVNEWIAENNQAVEEFKKMENFRREYIGNVSHELKTPIFILQGYLDTLLNGGIDDPKINLKYLQKAAKNADRLHQIVSDLDFIAKHEAGELVLNKKKFRMYDLVCEVMDELQPLTSENHITLECKEGSSIEIAVVADRERIRQVLTNLISNSIKYGRDHGTTTISLYDMHRDVLIEVSDNGIGIAQHHLPRLFERFYRVESSRARGQGGSGLGLAISKHIIEAHKRQLHVRSEVGLGTTFGFSLKKAN
jgi:two-component system phosphate regulon sensor histidine kinase PhoR